MPQQRASVLSNLPEWVKFGIVVAGAIGAVIIQGNRFENKIIENDRQIKGNATNIRANAEIIADNTRAANELSVNVAKLSGIIEEMRRD